MAVNLQSPLSKTVAEIWDEATMFNWSLNIPVIWKRAAKPDIRKARAKRWNEITTGPEHVLLLEDLHDGRLKRKKGDFLCSARKQSGNIVEMWLMDDRDVEKSKRIAVTCPKCKEIAQRWQ